MRASEVIYRHANNLRIISVTNIAEERDVDIERVTGTGSSFGIMSQHRPHPQHIYCVIIVILISVSALYLNACICKVTKNNFTTNISHGKN
jgi:hypothetical protein